MTGSQAEGWRRFRPRFGLGRMMGAVAVAAVLIIAWQGEGNAVAGAVIVGACVLILAWKLAGDAITRERASGKPIGFWHQVGYGLYGSSSALAIIGLADFTFLVIYFTVKDLTMHSHYYGRHLSIWGFLAGMSAVVFLTDRWRRGSL